MKLSELREIIESIPEKFDDFNIVNGDFGVDQNDNTFVFKTHEILTMYVDEKNNEIQLLHQSEEDVKDILINND